MTPAGFDRRQLLKVACACALWGLIPTSSRGQPADGAKRILLVHGRGQGGQNPETLKGQWIGALKRGAQALGRELHADVDVAFPFYGDALDEFVRQFAIPLTSDVNARGRPIDDEFLQFQAEFAEEVRVGAGVTDAQVDAEYGNDPTPRGPLNWRWVQAILRAIDKSETGMNQRTLEAFTRDVFLYTTRPNVRTEINKIVAAKLTEEPTVVVGHSLGSVVAYSVLRTDPRPLRVPVFVTVGSPLAVRAVRKSFQPLEYPHPVGAWYNAFDTRDVVALYPLDAENFAVDPPIENNSTVRNATDNRHGIVGYLDDRGVAKRILDGLAG